MIILHLKGKFVGGWIRVSALLTSTHMA